MTCFGFVTFFLWVLVPGGASPNPGLCAGGGDVEPGEEFVVPDPVPVFPVPVLPVPVIPVPVLPVPVLPVPVLPVPVFPVPVFPVPVFPVPPEVGGSLLGMRYDKGAA